MAVYGTLTNADTQAVANNTTVAEFGEQRLWDVLNMELEAHNRIWRELRGDFLEFTTEQQSKYGGGGGMEMDEVGEGGRADTQKITTGSNVGFPLRHFEVSVGWSRLYFMNATVAEVAAQFTDARRAHIRRLQREVKRAIYGATNTTFNDYLANKIDLPVKALVNADSAEIPLGPNGETFTAASHTHYLFTTGTSIAAADMDALVATLTEHTSVGTVRIIINTAQASAVRGLTGFTKILPTEVGGKVIMPATSALAIQGNVERRNQNDRLIGYYGEDYAEVWIKPWAVAGYLFGYVQGAPPPLRLREKRVGSSNLQVLAEDENYPLRAETMGADFGVGVFQRTNGAVLYIDTGNGDAYVSPTIT